MERTGTLINVTAKVGVTTLLLIATIVIVLNFLSGIVGGIWLAILGQWRLIISGFLLALFMPWFYAFANLPAMGLALAVAFFAERKNKIFTAILGLLASLYTNALMVVWVILVFNFFMGKADANISIPYLLCGYSTIMAPLSYMAKGEPPDSTGTNLGIFFAQICYFICVLFFFFGQTFIPWLYGIMIVGSVFSLFTTTILIVSMISEERMQKYHLEYGNQESEDESA